MLQFSGKEKRTSISIDNNNTIMTHTAEWKEFSKAQKAALWGPTGWKRVRLLGRAESPIPTSYGFAGALWAPSELRGRALAAQQFSHILNAPDAVSCCILGAFCTRKLNVVQRGKGSVRFWELCGIAKLATVTVHCTKSVSYTHLTLPTILRV